MGQGKFERKWQDAFKGAEMTPSDSVWTGIEASVANGEAARYKRKVIFYKWMAAAGILLFVGLLGYLSFQRSPSAAPEISEQLSQDRNTSSGVKVESSNSSNGNQNENTNSNGLRVPDGTLATDEMTPGHIQEGEEPSESLPPGDNTFNQPSRSLEEKRLANNPTGSDTALASTYSGTLNPSTDHLGPETQENDRPGSSSGLPAATDQRNNQNPILAEDTDLGQITDQRAHSLAHVAGVQVLKVRPLSPDLIMQDEPPKLQHMYGVALHPTENARPFESKLWAGLNMAPGYFDPKYQTSGLELDNQALGASIGFTPSEKTSGGFSLGIAVELGMNVSRRWEVNSGIQFFRNSLQSSTNAAINQTPVFSSVVESLDLSNNESKVRFAPTDLENDFQFISIPLEAGYRVFDSKIQLTVNGGIAADIFLKNTISPSDKSLEQVTIGPGAGSPFRTVYFNGLLGVQASYEIVPRYQITLQPQYRVAINQFTKPDNSYTSLPAAFGIGVGLKYNFK